LSGSHTKEIYPILHVNKGPSNSRKRRFCKSFIKAYLHQRSQSIVRCGPAWEEILDEVQQSYPVDPLNDPAKMHISESTLLDEVQARVIIIICSGSTQRPLEKKNARL
jgi:hypothetical protein